MGNEISSFSYQNYHRCVNILFLGKISKLWHLSFTCCPDKSIDSPQGQGMAKLLAAAYLCETRVKWKTELYIWAPLFYNKFMATCCWTVILARFWIARMHWVWIILKALSVSVNTVLHEVWSVDFTLRALIFVVKLNVKDRKGNF